MARAPGWVGELIRLLLPFAHSNPCSRRSCRLMVCASPRTIRRTHAHAFPSPQQSHTLARTLARTRTAAQVSKRLEGEDEYEALDKVERLEVFQVRSLCVATRYLAPRARVCVYLGTALYGHTATQPMAFRSVIWSDGLSCGHRPRHDLSEVLHLTCPFFHPTCAPPRPLRST